MSRPTQEETREAFADPRVGDRFQEFYSFWMEVVGLRPDGSVAVRRSTPRSPDPVIYATADEYRKAYQYKTIPGTYWVLLDRRGPEL